MRITQRTTDFRVAGFTLPVAVDFSAKPNLPIRVPGILADKNSAKTIVNDQIMNAFLHELNDHEELYDIQLYVGKLQDSRRRVNSVNQVIGSVHDRLSRVQKLIAQEIYKKKK